jgi:iron(III) transport system ATP-binding protein
MSHVSLTDLRKSYGVNRDATKAINGLDLNIHEGEFFVLLGPSGCGKTTTLRCIAGLEQPEGGSIRIGETRVAVPAQGLFVPPHKRDIGMVFQSYALWPHEDVLANVAYPVKARLGKDAGQARHLALRALELVGLLGLERRYPGELSGGQQQRVALARALAAAPRLVLFDEPLSNLDARLRQQLREELRRVHRAVGHTAVYVTHDQTEAMALADRIAVMNSGRLEQLGTPQEIFEEPASAFVARFLGIENVLSAKVLGRQGDHWVLDAGLGMGVLAGAKHHFAVDDRVELAVRASQLSVHPTAGSGLLALPAARIVDVHYLGGRYEALIEVGGMALRATLPVQEWGAPPHTLVGQTGVFLRLPDSGVMALPSDSGIERVTAVV